MNKTVESKKVVSLSKELYKVEDGKVYIESEELANAIQNQNVELFIDETTLEEGGNGWFCC